MQWLKNMFKSRSREAIALQRLGQPVLPPRDYASLSKEGHQKNAVVYKCISNISKDVGNLHLVLKRRKAGMPDETLEDSNHPLLKLLRKPNPTMTQSTFMEAYCAFYLIAGNTFIEAEGEGRPTELWPMRPDRVKIIPGSSGLPRAYEYKVGNQKRTFDVDQVRGLSPILHVKTFNPLDDWYGMSPMEAAVYSVTQHNEAGLWNVAMLQNMATPSGALVCKPTDLNPKGSIDDATWHKLEAKLDEKMSGSPNARRPILLEGGLDWKAMGFTPVEMDFINGRNVNARDIAMVYNVPPMILGIPGDATFSNYREARLALYEDTIMPTADLLLEALNNWLAPLFGEDIYIDYDKDMIDALAPRRESAWTRVQQADFLTINEKREELGWEPVQGGDELLVSVGRMPLSQVGGFFDDDDRIDDSDYSEERSKPVSIQRKSAETIFEDFLNRYIQTQAAQKVAVIQRTTKNRVVKAIRRALQEGLAEEELLDQLSRRVQAEVQSSYADFSRARAVTIARTETGIASNEASRHAAKAAKIPNMEKRWVARIDHRSRGSGEHDQTNHIAMNGETVGIDEKFLVPTVDGMEEMDGPQDPNASAKNVVNCRCTQVYRVPAKSLNMTPRQEQRFWLEQDRKRQIFERRFATQLRSSFRTEGKDLLDALEGITDIRTAEDVVTQVLELSKPDFENVFRVNYERILRDFGSQVLDTLE